MAGSGHATWGSTNEGDLADVALFKVPQQSSESVRVAVGPPRQRVFERDLGLGAGGDEQRFEAGSPSTVVTRRSSASTRSSAPRTKRDSSEVARELRKGVPVHASHRERLGHRRGVDGLAAGA